MANYSRRKNAIAFPVPCCYCGRALARETHTWEHIIPRSLGGTDDASNLAHACHPCNSERGNLPQPEFLAKQLLSRVREYNPCPAADEAGIGWQVRSKKSHKWNAA